MRGPNQKVSSCSTRLQEMMQEGTTNKEAKHLFSERMDMNSKVWTGYDPRWRRNGHWSGYSTVKFWKAETMKDMENWKRAGRLGQNNMEGGEKPQGLVTSSFQPRELRSHFAHWDRRWSTGYFLQIQDQIRRVEAGSSPISRAACFVDILFSFLEHLIFGKKSAYLANRCYQEYVYSCHSFSQLPVGSKCWAV